MYEYHCLWEAPVARFRKTAIAESLHELKDGFWINKYHRYTKHSGALYWIPPSAIKYIRRVEVGSE
jgi:hypothetical protein